MTVIIIHLTLITHDSDAESQLITHARIVIILHVKVS